jgi:hypothetical protein
MRIVSFATNHISANAAAQRDTTAEGLARTAVHALLERSPAFAALHPDRQHALASDTASVAAYLAGAADLTSQADALLREVDFPAFVAGLVDGVFGAVVDASIEQMKAYGELVKSVAHSIDLFVNDTLSARQARDHLTRNHPEFVLPEPASADTAQPPSHRLPVAAMLSAGIGRIMNAA